MTSISLLGARWPGWRQLPRDARDTLFLLGVIAWTVLPHVTRLPAWCVALTLAVLLWRGRIALANAALPPRWVVLVALGVVVALTFASYRTVLGKEAGVTLVVAMMALKTLELRARRDAFVVFFLGFFIVLTQFLGSQSIAVAAAMLISVWGLLTALVLAHMPVGQPSLRQAASLAARTALFGAPVMALLFVLFPRIGPLWGVPGDATGRTGLSSTLLMGAVATLAEDDSIAMRVRFFGPQPSPETLYFRGPVLSAFDGLEWKRLEPSFPAALRARAELRVTGPPIDYEVTLEPQRVASLPLLEMAPDTPESRPQLDGLRVTRRDDLQWQTDRPITERLRFTARAYLQFRHGPSDPVIGLQDELALPPGYNPRTLAWAAALRRDPRYAQADAHTLAAAVLEHIRTGGYTYTLEPGTYGDSRGRHAVDEFWIDRKLGFCEHFASAFVVVMRALDVPARIVTGYQGADRELSDGYLIVRNSHAHAWAEYWQPGRGWQRADPTAAVAPDRIDLSRHLVPPPGLVAEAFAAVSPTLLAQWRSRWEAVNNRWNQSVLNYSRGQQFELLKRLGVDSPGWEDLALLMIGALVTLSLAAAGWAWWDRRRQDPWLRLAARLQASLRQLGVAAANHHPPRALAEAVRSTLGGQGERLAELLLALDRLRYGRGASRLPPLAWRRAFRAEARALAQHASTRPR